MKVRVTFRHMDPDEELREYVQDKVGRLCEKYLHRPKDATVVLTAEKFRRTAEITIKAANALLNGKEETEDARSAVDIVLDKLEVQARKHREKYKPRRGGVETGAFSVYRGEEAASEDEDFTPRVIPDDKFVPKPMSIEDAVMALEDSRDDFLVFRNAKNMTICVLYRRPDGNYGLVEPEE